MGTEEEETEAAAQEAAAIGGGIPEDEQDLDPAQRPLVEAGQGEAEGFEQAEKQLEDIASHGDQHRFPSGRSRTDEEAVDAVYGEADRVTPADGPEDTENDA
jgi:hypothetical protein